MHKTPLFAAATAHGAHMDTFGEWMMPAAYPTAHPMQGPADSADRLQAAVDEEVDAARAAAVVFDLAPIDSVVVTGDAVRRWINGTFTHKYTDVGPGQGRRSVIVDDRGRVGGLVDWYCVAEDHFIGVLEGISADDFQQRYAMFMLLDDIEHDALDQHSLLSVQGPDTDAVLGRLGLPIPGQDRDHLIVESDAKDQTGLRILRRDRTGASGVDLLVPRAVLDTTWEALRAAGARPAGQLALEALRIFAGRPAWPADGTDKSMVHELGYNKDSVSFDKGCYVGQEVINRIERRGGVRKKLVRLQLAENALPPLGAQIQVDDTAVGSISSAARIHNQVWVLATVREAAWTDGSPVMIQAGDRSVSATVSLIG